MPPASLDGRSRRDRIRRLLVRDEPGESPADRVRCRLTSSHPWEPQAARDVIRRPPRSAGAPAPAASPRHHLHWRQPDPTDIIDAHADPDVRRI